ncbi:MAG: enoyl-CoA hydratase-related protein [Gemmatimonadales bacterium]
MTYSTLLLGRSDGVATLTVNRSDKLNALNETVIRELGEAADALAADPLVRGVILTGAGPKAFVAGADIGELASQSPMEGKRRSLMGQAVFRRFEAMRKPVVAAINGFCLGGGCELAMACHLRIASTTARFGQPEVKLGIGPGYGGTVRLPRLVGRGRALEMLLSAEMIGAEEAWRIGLVNRVVPADALLGETERLLRTILSQGPLAVAAVLEAVDAGFEMGQAEALLLEANHFGLLSSTADMQEGMAAFLAKRTPEFRGN